MNYTTALFCEIDKYAIESYCAIHHTPKDLNVGDVSAVNASDVPDFNVMFGGSPFQDFSVAGLQGGGCLDVPPMRTPVQSAGSALYKAPVLPRLWKQCN